MDAIIKLYKFNELNKEVQEKLIEQEIEEQAMFYCESFLQTDMDEQANILIEKYFNINTNATAYYDLSYSQGSGSMINFTINFEDINKKYKIFNNEEMRFIKDHSIINDVEIYHDDHLYYHEYTFSIKYCDNFGYYDYEDIKNDYKISKKNFEEIEDKIITLLDTYNKHNTESPFIQDIIAMNKELTKIGYNLIEDKNNFKQGAIDYLKENDVLYFEDGSIFNKEFEEVK